MSLHRVFHSSTFMIRLPHGCDLIEELTAIRMREGILRGQVRAIGVGQKACISFCD